MTSLPSHDPISALTPGAENEEHWVTLLPRDAVHVRDGRTIISGAGGAARTRQPWPSTVAGALGAAVRKAGGSTEPRTVRGPILARRSKGQRWQLHFPVPADLVPGKDHPKAWHRLRPGDDDGVVTDLGDRAPGLRPPTAEDADTAVEDRWLGANQLQAYLHGEGHRNEGLNEAPRPLTTELRTGIAVRDRRVLHSHMYTTEFLRLGETDSQDEAHLEWAFMALGEFVRGASPPRSCAVRLGGAGRVADLEVCEDRSAPSLPEPPPSYPGGNVLVYLATPAIWRHRNEDGLWSNTWRPPHAPAGAELVSAAVNGPQHVASSGQGRRGDPEYAWLQWAVPAGSVYLLRFSGDSREARENAAAAWASQAHGRAWGERGDNGDAHGQRLATAGFGLILTGTWT